MVPVGVVVADVASIKSVRVVDGVDDDGDGAVSSFNIEIVADTNCIGCNDESDDDPNIEPQFTVTIVGVDGNAVELDSTETLGNDNDLTYVYEIPDDVVQQYDAQRLEIRVVLTDHDPFLSDEMDTRSLMVDYEPPGMDQATPPPTTTTTPPPTTTTTSPPTTTTPPPTTTTPPPATTTPPPATTSTTPPPTTTTPPPAANNEAPVVDQAQASDSGASGSGSGEAVIRDSDGDGVIDSRDYAPNDPQVQEKEDLRSLSVPGFGPLLVIAALLVGGIILLRRRM